MKSREEFEASIYKKRDALLAKRKKKIQMTVSAMSVVICLGAAAVAIPVLSEKPEEAALPSATNAASGITENKIAAEIHDEISTYPASYDTGIVFTEQHNFSYHNDFNIESIEGEKAETVATEITEIYQIPDGEIGVEQGASEEKPTNLINQIIDGIGEFKPESPDGAFDAMAETPSKKNFTTEEIVEQAKKYVTDADKIIDDKTNVTVSRNMNGTTTYTAYFYTEDKKITVELDSNLTVREVKEKDNSSNGTTHIAPAYNPNEE